MTLWGSLLKTIQPPHPTRQIFHFLIQVFPLAVSLQLLFISPKSAVWTALSGVVFGFVYWADWLGVRRHLKVCSDAPPTACSSSLCDSLGMLRGSGHMSRQVWVLSRYLPGLLARWGGWDGTCWQRTRRRGQWCSRPCMRVTGGMAAPRSLQPMLLLGRQELGRSRLGKACCSSQRWGSQRRRPGRLWSSVITTFRLPLLRCFNLECCRARVAIHLSNSLSLMTYVGTV